MDKERNESGIPGTEENSVDSSASADRHVITDEEYKELVKKGTLSRIERGWGQHYYGKKEFLEDWIEHVKMGGRTRIS